MIGKLFVPLAIGGGLIFLLSSAASASTSSSAGSAPKNPFNQLPDNLRQLAGQAQGTNDPNMLEQVATQLEAQGFSESARVLRSQATALRQRSQSVFEQLPDNLKQLAGQAQATNDPNTLEQVAGQLEAQGFREPANLLRVQAGALRQRSQGFVASPNGASSPGIVPSGAQGATPTVLSPELQKMVADAVQSGAPAVLTSTAFVLEKAGFQAVADELRRRAKDAAASVPMPPVQDHPNAAIDTSMPADLAAQVARQLQLQGDPSALDALAAELRKRGFSSTADQVTAKAQQIRTMLDAARTMHDIDSEFKTPGIAPTLPAASPAAVQPSAAPPLPGAPRSRRFRRQSQQRPRHRSRCRASPSRNRRLRKNRRRRSSRRRCRPISTISFLATEVYRRLGSRKTRAWFSASSHKKGSGRTGPMGPRAPSTWLATCRTFHRPFTGGRALGSATSAPIARTSKRSPSRPTNSATRTALRGFARAR